MTQDRLFLLEAWSNCINVYVPGKPNPLLSLLYSKLLHSAAAHSFPQLRRFLVLLFFAFEFLLVHFPGFVRLSEQFVHHCEREQKGRKENKYRFILVPVQKLRLLDENPAPDFWEGAENSKLDYFGNPLKYLSFVIEEKIPQAIDFQTLNHSIT